MDNIVEFVCLLSRDFPLFLVCHSLRVIYHLAASELQTSVYQFYHDIPHIIWCSWMQLFTSFFLYFSPSFSSVSSHIFRRSNVVWVTFKKYPKNHAHNWFTYSILFLWDFSELLARLFPARNFPRCSNHVYTWLFSRLLLQSFGDD